MEPEISVVIPVCNEELNVEPLAREIELALGACAHEVLFIDDGSTDGTAAAVLRARAAGAPVRLIRHARRCGQSAGLCTGMRHARAAWVATLDGDGQNDPADIAGLLAARAAPGNHDVRLFMGHRVTRRDTWLRRLSSRVANGVRSRLLRDATPDTGCGIKLIHRATFAELPRFDHMHRFLPALMQRAGARVVSVPVNHRPRERGLSKYGLLDRLWVGIVDLFGVAWLQRRKGGPLEVSEE
ncbi:MAG: glycosyltransferase [Gammaproteobacteria bacterium]|nr:glycosyltransferase [Gammaproteobacteria bacterium]